MAGLSAAVTGTAVAVVLFQFPSLHDFPCGLSSSSVSATTSSGASKEAWEAGCEWFLPWRTFEDVPEAACFHASTMRRAISASRSDANETEGEEVEVDDADVKSSCADCERGMDVAVKTNDSLELAPRRLRGAEKSAEHDDALAALTCALVQA